MLLSAVLIVSVGSGCGGKSGEKVDVQAQIPKLSSADQDARANACIELAKAGPNAAPAMKALIPVLKDPDALVRRLAAYALGEVGEKAKEAVPALKELLNDGDSSVAIQANLSIRAIDPKDPAGKAPQITPK